MKAVGITTWFQFTQEQYLFCHEIILPFWLLFCRWFGYYVALVWKIDTTSLTCECSHVLWPNFKNFCPNNGQFFSVGVATASPYRTLMHSTVHRSQGCQVDPFAARNLVPNSTCWPQNFGLALFQDRFGPLRKLDLTTLGPVWETIFFHIFD